MLEYFLAVSRHPGLDIGPYSSLCHLLLVKQVGIDDGTMVGMDEIQVFFVHGDVSTFVFFLVVFVMV